MLPQFQGLEDFPSDPYFFHRIAGQRHPQGVADPLVQKGSEPDGAFDGAAPGGPRLGDPDVSYNFV